ncbi:MULTISPECIES: hypothetical protein [Bradyrhizobium]|uniref:Uncharacterized protein n=1 Tax=Bradyrhizobium brasilense TaxID=1419277 RepID=A0ABY8J9S7_9BRAD|nr:MULTISPECIES: hypothetical protein [Bradyrhizobium]MCP1853052.1 hypothetical protein [Bradyrhizobium sp. USDA 4541]WFU61215.1 hypothetical protein QA636_27280 [Bradyrhizobium brasilense]
MEKPYSRLIDQRLEQLQAHRTNIRHYRWLLKTQLSDLERQFIERRIGEELEATQGVASDAPPLGICRLSSSRREIGRKTSMIEL